MGYYFLILIFIFARRLLLDGWAYFGLRLDVNYLQPTFMKLMASDIMVVSYLAFDPYAAEVLALSLNSVHLYYCW